MSANDSDTTPDNAAHGGCRAATCSSCGYDPFAMEAAKAACNTLVRDNERLRDRAAQSENDACLAELKIALMEQDMETIREIITKGGTAADILKFLDTPNA